MLTSCEVVGTSTTLLRDHVTLPTYVGYWMSQLKYENGRVFEVGHPGISHIIICLSGGVIVVYGPKGVNYSGGLGHLLLGY